MPTDVMGELGVDVSDFKKFARALRRAAPAMALELRANLRGAGQEVAKVMRDRASFSTRIQKSVKVRTSGPGVAVVAGGKKAPGAAPLDNHGQPGTFRHPVFGNRNVWVTQKARPFFRNTAAEALPAARQAALNALDGVVKKVADETGR